MGHPPTTMRKSTRGPPILRSCLQLGGNETPGGFREMEIPLGQPCLIGRQDAFCEIDLEKEPPLV